MDIALYRGTTFVQWIAWYVPAANGSFNWRIPTNLSTGTNYRVRILDYVQRDRFDDSDANFRIR